MTMTINKFYNSSNMPKVMSYVFAALLLSFHSLLFANVAMAKEVTYQNGNSIKYYSPEEQREVTIMLNIKHPGMIKGSMWVNIDSIVTAPNASAKQWNTQIETAKNHIKDTLRFLTGNRHTDINIEFPKLENKQQKSPEGFEVVTFSFAKHVRGVWEIDVPQDMKALNIAVLAGMQRKMRSAQAGKSLTLII